MKNRCILGILLGLASLASADLRTFTALDGRTLKAQITDYNEPKGVVTIQREDGKSISVKPEAFSEKDQTYIRKWHEGQVFLSETKLQLDLKGKKGETTKQDHEVDYSEQSSGRGSGRGTQIVAVDQRTKYDLNLTLKNISKAELKNIALEYRIFYEQQKPVLDEEANKNRPTDDEDIPDIYKAEDETKVREGKARLKPAEPGSDRTITPATFTLLKRSATGRGYGDKITLQSGFIGAWVRLTMKGADGETLTRDVYTSNTIPKKFSWETPEEMLAADPPN